MKIGLYPGSFDPITNGHLDIIKRSASIFDHLVVVVMLNSKKTPLFDEKQRVQLIQEAVADLPNVTVDSYEGLLVNYVESHEVTAIVKGLRAISDFEMEFQMASMNKKLNDKAETVFMMTATEYSYLSSSMVKEVFAFGGDISGLVPEHVLKYMKLKKAL